MTTLVATPEPQRWDTAFGCRRDLLENRFVYSVVSSRARGLGWEAGTFMAVYNAERAGMHEIALQASLVAAPLWEFMKKQRERTWSGTAGVACSPGRWRPSIRAWSAR